MQAAREEDLAYIQIVSAQRVAAAIALLERQSRQLVVQLYGQGGATGDLANAGQGLADTLSNVGSELEDATRGLREFADDLLIGELSPLTGRDKLNEAMRLLMEASASGDVGRVQSLANATLGIGRDVFASGSDFNELFARVQDIIRGTVPTVNPAGPGGPGTDGFGAGGPAALTELERFEMASVLAQNVADLADVTGDSFDVVADRLGFGLEELALDLGVPLDRLTEYLTSLQPSEEADAIALVQSVADLDLTFTEASADITEAVTTSGQEIVEAVNEQTDIGRESVEIGRETAATLAQLVAILRSTEPRSSRYNDIGVTG